jgi:signal transduction histidine kinase
MEPLLRVNNLTKTFGSLTVLQGVSFAVSPGEVVGLAGRNGAGKSVLAQLLAGLHPVSVGELYFAGSRVRWPFAARRLGIEVIHQEPVLAENLDIPSNIFLGHEIGAALFGRWLRWPHQVRMDQAATRLLDQLEVQFPSLRTSVRNLSSEQRQLVAIAQVMTQPAKLIVVDEPTALLSYRYQQRLLTLIQEWQQAGIAVIFSSNNLEHLFAVSDRLITLRRGRQVAEHNTDEVSREEIVAELVGAASHEQLTPALWALDSYYRAREQAEKLRHQQALMERDLVAQDALNRQLVEQLARQVAALDQANAALQAAQRRLFTEREEERKHLARELHDQVIQDLLSLNYDLETLEAGEQVPGQVVVELSNIREEIRTLVHDVRLICGSLRPPTIDSLGLGAALKSHTREWGERTGITVTLELDSHLSRLPEAIELSLFRIIQEGLNNVRKHAQATAVTIYLKHTSPRTIMLSIADNGCGLATNFDLATLAVRGHYGLLGISERVALLGGRLRVQNQPGGGALLQAEIPHPRVEATVAPS